MELTHYATIQQQHRHPSKTTDAYRFISTREVLDTFAELGWFPAQVREAGVRKQENYGFQNHLIRLENPTFHAREIGVGDCKGHIVLRNAHNGQSSFNLYAGLLELVCRNGLVVDRKEHVSIPHRGYAAWMVAAAVEQVARQFRGAFEERERWRGIRLQRDEQLAFADAAISLRFDRQAVEVDPAEILTPRRWEQAEPTIWHVFNTLQENILRGGVRQVRSDGSRFRSRAVKSIDEDLRINRELWQLARELEKAVQ